MVANVDGVVDGEKLAMILTASRPQSVQDDKPYISSLHRNMQWTKGKGQRLESDEIRRE